MLLSLFHAKGRLRLGRHLYPRVVAVALATRAGILLAHMMDAFEVAEQILNPPTIVGADLLTLYAAARAGTLLRTQFVDPSTNPDALR